MMVRKSKGFANIIPDPIILESCSANRRSFAKNLHHEHTLLFLVLCLLGRFKCAKSPLLSLVEPLLSVFHNLLPSSSPASSVLVFLLFSFAPVSFDNC